MFRITPGLAAAVAVAAVAQILGDRWPAIGAPIFAVAVGLAISRWFGSRLGTHLGTGLRFTSKTLLQIGIVLIGFNLDLYELAQSGYHSLPVLFGTLAVALVTGFAVGRTIRIPWRLTVLVTVGTAICGASAIAATATAVVATADDIAYAISTVFFYNILAIVIFPAVGHLLQLSDLAFGLWSGTAINDTSSVVAVAYSYSEAAGQFAVAVKLARSTMILPIVLVLALFMSWRHSDNLGRATLSTGHERVAAWLSVVPWFIFLFFGASLLFTSGAFPDVLARPAAGLGRFLMITALAAVGMTANFKQLRSTGFIPLLLGFIVWIATASSSLLIQWSLGSFYE